MRIENGFTSLHGGGGADTFFGADDLSVRERFFGGSGDDTIQGNDVANRIEGGGGYD